MTKKKPGSLERITENVYPTYEEVQSRQGSGDLNKYRDGDFDYYLGHLIKSLIYKDEKRLVYLDENCDVQWSSYAAYHSHEVGHILNRAAEIEQTPDEHLSQAQLETAHRYVGETIARAFKGDFDEATEILDKAELWIKMRNEELGRIWQLTGSFITFSIAIVGVLLLIFSSQVKQMLNVTTLDILFGSIAGCIGAFLSLALRTGTLKLDSSAGKTLHMVEGGVRVIAGGVGAFFIAFAIKANLLLGAIDSTSYQFPLLISFCIAAGFSERFVPSLVQTLESKALDNENQKSNNEIIEKMPKSETP